MRHFSKKSEQSGIFYYGKKTLVSVAFGVAFLFILLCVFSFALDRGALSRSAVSALMLAAIVITGFAAGFVGAKLWKEKGLLAGAATGLSLFVLLLLFGIIFGGGNFSPLILIRFLVLVTSSALGGVVGVNHHKRVRP